MARPGVAEHMRMAGHELVVDPAGHVGQGELSLLGTEHRVEDNLEEEIAELLLEVAEACAGVDVEVVDGVEHLVRLLEQVAGEGGVGLLTIPRAGGPQRADQLVEADQLRPHGLGEHRDPQRGQVVSGDGPVEVGPGHGTHRCVGQPQPLQHRDGRPVADGQLDLGEHALAVALGHEERAPLTRRFDRESVTVDQAHAGGERVHAQGGPSQVQVGQPGLDHEVHLFAPGRDPQQLDGALGHQRGAGHGVERLAVLSGRDEEPPHDLLVHVVEPCRALVDAVEAGRSGHDTGRGVARRAHEALRRTLDGGERASRDERGAGRAEPDHGDPARHVTSPLTSPSPHPHLTPPRSWWCWPWCRGAAPVPSMGPTSHSGS